MALSVPPPSNVGPMSEPWARYITEQVEQNARAIENMGGDASNDGRINNSAMDTISSQLNEIQQRQSGYSTADEITTDAFNGTGTSAPTVARQIQLSRPSDAPRSGWLAVTFDVTQSTADFGVAFLTLSIDGRVFHKASVGFPVSTITPVEWGANTNVAGFTGFIATPNSGGLLRIELTGSATGGSNLRTVTARDFQVTHQYSQVA